jgi:hypothetical protein
MALSGLKGYDRVLIITYRISLDEELAKNFGFELYSDFNTGFIDYIYIYIDYFSLYYKMCDCVS